MCSLLRMWGKNPRKDGNLMANKTLYVGNMSYNSTENDLRNLFEPFGPISEIRVIGDKGFAFVEIPDTNAEAAITATNGKEFGGRTLTVNEARPRAERSSGGRGGYGGGRSNGGGRW